MNAKRFFTYVISGALLVFVAACKNTQQAKEDSEVTEFKNDLEDTAESAKKLVKTEKKEMINTAEATIDDFEKQLKVYEASIENSGQELKSDVKETLTELKKEKKALEQKINEINASTKEDWTVMKKEFNHDMEDFKESVDQFFEDNV